VRRLVVLCLLALGLSGLVPGTAHAASTSSLLATTIPATTADVTLLRLPAAALSEGEQRYFHASYNATGHLFNSSDKILQTAQLRCKAGNQTVTSAWSTTNRYAAAVTGSIQVYWLFAVPTTASWTCELHAHAASTGDHPSDTLTVNAGSGTYLFMNDEAKNGASWQDGTDTLVIAPGRYQYVLRKTWPATDTGSHGTVINVLSGVEVSPNYGSDSDNSSTLTVQLAVIQGGNSYCAEHDYTVGPMVVNGYEHHKKVYVAATDVPVDPNCPMQWAIKTRITDASGVSATVNLSGYSDTLAYWG
jgi:hypothetical protein